jgi:N-dimethylarginine dimethylaminohydrolase
MSKSKKKKEIKIDPKYGAKQLKDGSYKVYSWKIRLSPSDTLPDMVRIEHAGLEISKRFVTFEHAVRWIETNHIETFLEKTGAKVQKELKTIGKGDLVDSSEIDL